jgi:hypothetical protein
MASLSERVGTDAENSGDQQKLQTLWKYAPSAYSGEHIVELPYVWTNHGSVTGGNPNPVTITGLQQFKLNSIYDPDLTGSGNQPTGRDTYAAIYDYYKVLETDVRMEIVDLTYRENLSSTNQNLSQPTQLGWMADITANPPANITQWNFAAELGDMNKQQRFGTPKLMDVIAGRGDNTYRSHYHWNPEHFDTAIIDTAGKNTWTPVGSDPANLNYLTLLMYNPEPIATGSARYVIAKVTVRFLVAFKTVNRTLLNTIN